MLGVVLNCCIGVMQITARKYELFNEIGPDRPTQLSVVGWLGLCDLSYVPCGARLMLTWTVR